MSNAIIWKLESWFDLSPLDISALSKMTSSPVRAERGTDLARVGESSKAARILLEGWAYRYKVLPSGKRLIVGFLLPGDVFDLAGFNSTVMDHAITTLSLVSLASVSHEVLSEVITDHPNILTALRRSTFLEAAILREWLANISGRDAYMRTAHLLCELWHRMAVIGLVRHGSCDFPVTQSDLGEALSLTAVTINRVLQRLRSEGLIRFQAKQLTVLSIDGLKHAAEFDASYLDIPPAPRQERRLAGPRRVA